MKRLVTFVSNAALAIALTGAALPAAAAESQPASCRVPNSEAAIRVTVPAERSPLSVLEGQTGTATVRVALDADGTAHDPAIVRSSGSAYLDADALKAALAQVYAPATHDCTPAGGTYLVIVDFAHE